MLLRYLLLLGLLLAALPGLAQQDITLDTRVPEQEWLLRSFSDSLGALDQHQQAGHAVAAERIIGFLLTRFPGRVLVTTAVETARNRYADYPQRVYQQRAELRRARRDWRGAEADLTAAIRYAQLVNPALNARGTDYYRYHAPLVQLLRETHYARAYLRREYLSNYPGSCADQTVAYHYDTVRASSLSWRGCAVPRTRLPLDRTLQVVLRQRADSIGQVQRYLAAHQPQRAARLLARIRAGRVGAYQEVPPVDIYQEYQHPERNLVLLAAQAAAQLGQPARGRVLLDSLLRIHTGSVGLRYQRGIFLIDNQIDTEAGCEDLRWVYNIDSTRTGPGHPRWRNCPLPRYKVPVGSVEVSAYDRALQDSLSRAEQLLTAARPAAARRLLTRLLTTGAAGRYAPPVRPRPEQPSYQQVTHLDWQCPAHDARSRAFQALGEYPQAVAELDTLIRYFRGVPDYYCRRGVLRADYLHDQAGACPDLNECYNRGGGVNGPRPARGCDIAARHLGARILNSPPLHVFDDAQYPVWQGGLVRQGRLTGVQIGRLFNANKTIDETLYGPGMGLEMAGNATDFVLAPKLSYEAVGFVVGGRLDVAYYLNQRLRGDLRLTPQIGFCPLGVLNIYYGYAVPLAGTRIEALGTHRVSLYINLLSFGKIGG